MPKLTAEQLPTFFARLRDWKGRRQTVLSIELIMHVPVRTSELRWAENSEFGSDTWRIPAERMKMERDFVTPLTPRAQELVAELRDIAGKCSRFLLPIHTTKTGVVQANWIIGSLYKMGYKGIATTHGFRDFSTVMNERKGKLGFHEDWIEFQLAHVEDNKVRGAYNAAEYLDDRRTMMIWWSEFLEAQKDTSDLIG